MSHIVAAFAPRPILALVRLRPWLHLRRVRRRLRIVREMLRHTAHVRRLHRISPPGSVGIHGGEGGGVVGVGDGESQTAAGSRDRAHKLSAHVRERARPARPFKCPVDRA